MVVRALILLLRLRVEGLLGEVLKLLDRLDWLLFLVRLFQFKSERDAD